MILDTKVELRTTKVELFGQNAFKISADQKCFRSCSQRSVSELILTESELDLIKELVDCLEVIEVGATALSKRDVDILKSEKIFEFILSKLKENSFVSEDLYNAVTERINERRNSGTCGLVI